MPRYIYAKALARAISLYANRTSLGQICPPDLSYSEMLDIIADAPTADVVPRADFEALKDEADRYKRYFYRHDYDEMIAEAKAEVAREIFEKIEKLMFGYMVLPLNTLAINYDKYTELKKKYTGE